MKKNQFALALMVALVSLASAETEYEYLLGKYSQKTVAKKEYNKERARLYYEIETAKYYNTADLDLTSFSIMDSVPAETFKFFGSLKSIRLPASITSIGEGAFYRCYSLTDIRIPASVTLIGDKAFKDCESLKTVIIPDGLTSIGRSAFAGCTSLSSVTIPNSVTSIGEYAFSRCSSLTSIRIPKSVTSIGEGVFYECTQLRDIYFSGSKKQWNEICEDKKLRSGKIKYKRKHYTQVYPNERYEYVDEYNSATLHFSE